MATIIKAHIKRMEVTRNSTSFPLGYRTECTTTLEIEGALPKWAREQRERVLRTGDPGDHGAACASLLVMELYDTGLVKLQ